MEQYFDTCSLHVMVLPLKQNLLKRQTSKCCYSIDYWRGVHMVLYGERLILLLALCNGVAHKKEYAKTNQLSCRSMTTNNSGVEQHMCVYTITRHTHATEQQEQL
jgi:hypothetical protein